jgi:Rps23 Pro-64 3,4-dihydroxylase Tpa1-like proline 4-hydroxylase
MLKIQPEVEHLTGKTATDWEHFSVSSWLYPPTTALSLHDDGSGIYSGAYVYFLNPSWKLHWGGLLLLMDEEANQAVRAHRRTQEPLDYHNSTFLHANQLDELIMQHGFAKCIMPKRNRMVFIANDAYHMVTRVNESAGDNVRMSLAGFFQRKRNK